MNNRGSALPYHVGLSLYLSSHSLFVFREDDFKVTTGRLDGMRSSWWKLDWDWDSNWDWDSGLGLCLVSSIEYSSRALTFMLLVWVWQGAHDCDHDPYEVILTLTIDPLHLLVLAPALDLALALLEGCRPTNLPSEEPFDCLVSVSLSVCRSACD